VVSVLIGEEENYKARGTERTRQATIVGCHWLCQCLGKRVAHKGRREHWRNQWHTDRATQSLLRQRWLRLLSLSGAAGGSLSCDCKRPGSCKPKGSFPWLRHPHMNVRTIRHPLSRFLSGRRRCGLRSAGGRRRRRRISRRRCRLHQPGRRTASAVSRRRSDRPGRIRERCRRR